MFAQVRALMHLGQRNLIFCHMAAAKPLCQLCLVVMSMIFMAQEERHVVVVVISP